MSPSQLARPTVQVAVGEKEEDAGGVSLRWYGFLAPDGMSSQEETTDDTAGIPCFNCGQAGHSWDECPKILKLFWVRCGRAEVHERIVVGEGPNPSEISRDIG